MRGYGSHLLLSTGEYRTARGAGAEGRADDHQRSPVHEVQIFCTKGTISLAKCLTLEREAQMMRLKLVFQRRHYEEHQ